VSYKVAQVDEIEGFPYRDDTNMHAVRHHLGISAFGTNAWTAENVGDRLVPEHEEDPGSEELYVVVRGRARFEIDGDTVDAPQGTLVFARPEAKRTAFAEEPGTTLLVFGSVVGQPYEPSGWEIWASAHPAYEAGDYEAAIERTRPIVEANPQYAAPAYNLACCEALSGRKEDAIEHLRIAIGRREQLRDLAKGDSDLDSLREEPAFQELVG